MYKLEVYIQGEKLELFDDENVFLNQTVQNVRDISKIFTDFTQSFTIPASKNNNKIFKHWYNADIVGGFSAGVRVPGALELSTLPFKDGLIQLESCNLKNGIVHSYKITFYGNLVQLTDLFGDDKLDDLDLSDYNHTYSDSNVLNGLSINNGLLSGDVIYPLVASRSWVWDAFGTSLQEDDIKFDGGNTSGIDWYELKPALKVNRIVDKILDKYGLTFVDMSFFDNVTDNLFMWFSNSKENANALGDYEKVICDTELLDIRNEYNPVTGTWTCSVAEDVKFSFGITPASGFEDVEYSMLFYVNGVPQLETKGLVDVNSIQLNLSAEVGDTVECYMRTSRNITFLSGFAVFGEDTGPGIPFPIVRSITSANVVISSTSQLYMSSDAENKGNAPDITVTDFIDGLFKMFNLVIIPLGQTTFDVRPLDDWYANGSEYDITKFVDISEIDVNRPDLNKKIEYKYNETETILGEKFRELNNIGYGDLEAEFDYDGGSLDISVGFDNMLFEKLSSQLDGEFSDVFVGKAIDDDLNAVVPNPILFFNRGITTAEDGFAFIDDSAIRNDVKDYVNVGVEKDLSDGQTLNFGTEISAWDFAEKTNSLYLNYWSNYVDDLYNPKRRVYKYKAIIPLTDIIKINLNDRLIIRDSRYVINNINTNLVTGETKLELINTDRNFTL